MGNDENKNLKILSLNPSYIKSIENPTEEMQIIAVKSNGMLLNYIKNSTEKVKWETLKANK